MPLLPWQEEAVIRIGELYEDGRPRFKESLLLVARQNGKTHLLMVLSLYWLFVEQCPLVMGMSTNLETAKEAWLKAVEQAELNEHLSVLIPKNGVRRANGDQTLTATAVNGANCRYKIAASNRTGGRGFTIDRLIMDELREHQDWNAYNAAVPATNARPNAQVVYITNQGDDRSVVLDSLRDSALEFIKTGTGDERLGIFEWSAPDGADITDPQVWAYANPSLGYMLPLDAIRGPALRAAEKGGTELTGFMTEMLCMRVKSLDAAVDAMKWEQCFSEESLAELKAQVSFSFDVSPDYTHATLVAASVVNDKVRLEVVRQWHGQDAIKSVVTDLADILRKHKPKRFGYMPNGPAAAYVARLKSMKLPSSVSVEEIRGEVADACMGFADDVSNLRIEHSGDPLLTTHVTAASKLWNGERWRFSRKGQGHCDAAYAAAGAVILARTAPPPIDYTIHPI